jgi:ribonuclease HII
MAARKSSKKYSSFSLEYSFLQKGFTCVGGMDEVGRGCLAGPVVAAVVAVSNQEQYIPGVWDSKQMSEKQREEHFEEIMETVEGYGIGEASNLEIDELGISDATTLAMKRAYRQLNRQVDIMLTDGRGISIPHIRMRNIVKGDSKHFVISAASVIAKVHRDRKMKQLARKYDIYGFERNVGYGTKDHRDALKEFGFCEIHRKSFAPIKDMLKGTNEPR